VNKAVDKLYYGEKLDLPENSGGGEKLSLVDKTYLAISRLEIDQQTKAVYRKRAEKYFNDCGCSLGAFFLVAALAFLVFHWLYFGEPFLSSFTSTLLVFPAAILGKLLGIGIGRIRLFVLFKKLSRRRGEISFTRSG